MIQRNSLAVLLRTWLLLSMLFVARCGGRVDEAEKTPVVGRATAVPAVAPSSTPTATRPWPTPEFVPLETPTPVPTPWPGYAANSAARRVIFILDNSDSVVNECFDFRQEPAHSEGRRAMSAMVVFLVDLFAELERAAATRPGTPEITIEVGIYALHPYHDVWTPQPVRELVAIQNVDELRAGWDEPMVALLDARSIDMYGWDLRWLTGPGSPLANGPDQSSTVILLTDGYTGVAPTPAPGAATPREPGDERRWLGQQLGALPGKLDFNVVQFNCPNLATYLGALPTPDNLYIEADLPKSDARMWQELAEREADGGRGITFYQLDLPRSAAATRYDATATWRTFAPVAQGLLAQLNMPALCPPEVQVGEHWLAGYGWRPAAAVACVTAPGDDTASALPLPSRDAPARLPGDTATFALRLVAASSQPGGYSVFFRRGDETFRYALNAANAGHVYTIDREDHILRDVLAAEGELCGEIEWWVEGPEQVSFAWWQTQPARYSIRAVPLESTIVNNGFVQVNYEIEEEVAEPGNADCYELRVRLDTAGGGERVKLVPLRSVYPEMRGRVVFFDYAFNPKAHSSLSVIVDLVENLGRTPGEDTQPPGPPLQRVVVAELSSEKIANEYVPSLSGSPVVHTEGCSTDEDEESSPRESGCYFEITFDFVQDDYWPDGPLPRPQFYALNTLERADVGSVTLNDTPDEDGVCGGLTATKSFRTPSPGNREKVYLSGQYLQSWGSDDADSLVTTYDTARLSAGVVSIGLIRDLEREACGYEAFLIQWTGQQDWPSVVCEQAANTTVSCWEVQPDRP